MDNSSRPSASSAAAPQGNNDRTQQAERLYERFGKPLESAHSGEFVAIAPDGRTVLGASLVEAIERGTLTFGPGSYVFRIGEGVAATWR